MIPLGLGVAWGLVAGVWLWSRVLPVGRAVAGRADHGLGVDATFPTVARKLGRRGRSALGTLGWLVRSAVVRFVPARITRGTTSSLVPVGQATAAHAARDAGHDANDADVRLGLALVAGVLLAVVVHPTVALVPVTGGLVWRSLQSRRAARHQAAAVVEQLPDVVDLLRLTTLAGLPVSTALDAIGARPGGPVGGGLQRAADRLARGSSTAQALACLAESCGPPAQPLVDALIDHDRYGTPLGPALDRVGIESRLQRRRYAEEAARRLPVTLLFPLVFTTLPACALLTVVPLLVASLSSLRP